MRRIKVSNEVLSFFAALCFLGAWAEYLLPKPLPFLRFGLANFPILIAAVLFSPKMFFSLSLMKIFCQGMVAGTFFSPIFLFSLCSSITSALITFILASLFFPTFISFVGMSLAGALGANLMQAFLAKIILGFEFSAVALPLFTLGIVTSVALGFFADFFFRKSETVAKIQEGNFSVTFPEVIQREGEKPKMILAAVGIILLVIILFAKSLSIILPIFILSLVLNLATSVKISLKPAIIFMFFVVFFNLFSPAGKVLFSLGGFKITEFALKGGIEKALRMQGMIFLSTWIFKNKAFPRGKFSEFLDGVLALANKFTEKVGKRSDKLSPAFLVKVIDETLSEEA